MNPAFEPVEIASVQVGKETRTRPFILDCLNNWQYVEKSLHRLLAAWGRRFDEWEDKSAVHRQVWDQAEIVQKLRDRIVQFPGGNPDAPVSRRLEELGNTVLRAPSFPDAVEGIHEILGREMARVYIAYARHAHPVHDAPTITLLHDICALKEQHWLWMRDYRRRHPHRVDPAYRERILEAWKSCGGLARPLPVGEPARPIGVATDFRLPLVASGYANWQSEHDIMPYIRVDFSGSVETRRLFWAVGYLREKSLPDNQLRWIYWGHFMPWEFHYNISRHLWDESRHGDSGYSRLQDFGIRIEEIGFPEIPPADPLALDVPLDARALYEEVFFIGMVAEQGHFIVKNEGYQDFRDGDDLESAEMMLFDIIDETQHVQYAHKWLPVLAEHSGLDNSGYRERAAARRKHLQQEELAAIARDKNLPRNAGVPAWVHYQDLLARIRDRKPLSNAGTCGERSPKPM